MLNNKLVKIMGFCLFLFIICFSLISCAYADDLGKDKELTEEKSLVSQVRILNTLTDGHDDDLNDDDFDDGDYDFGDDEFDEDDWDDDELDEDDSELDDDSDEEDVDEDTYCSYCGGECDNCDFCLSQEDFYKEFNWKGNSYYIDLGQFNLTEEELTELFTKRDYLIEEIEKLERMIEAMELSRNNDTLLAINALYDYINNLTNNTEFNDFLLSLKFNELLLSLKNINITELNSTFNELKMLLESIKGEYPDEDFTEIDLLMANLEILLNEELEIYENSTSELEEKLAELFELFDKYPFLKDHTKYSIYYDDIVDGVSNSVKYAGGYKDLETGSESSNKVLAGMKNTGIPYFSLVILLLVMIFGFNIKRRF